jgi:D-alanine-D-alanine ligase
MALRVLHLVGSAVSEFLDDLSRLYARDCLETVGDAHRYAPVIAHVAPDRRWRFPVDLSDAAIAAAPACDAPAALARISELGIELVVPQMFCLPGMTEYRALFDVLKIPYLGNRPEVMAIGAHKARAKAIVAAAGVAVARGELVGVGELPVLAPPAVVKPVDGDNSLGMTLVCDRADYPAAVADACAHGSAALVEQYVELGREVRCGVLEQGGELSVLPLEEYAVDPGAKPVRDGADKLRRADGGGLALVAKDTSRAWIVDPADPICEAVAAAARRAHRALGCRHYSLFDFRIDRVGRPVFLEASLYCSFAHQSVISTMARAAGIATDDLFRIVVSEALDPRRHP